MGSVLGSLLNKHYNLMNRFLLLVSRVMYRKLSSQTQIRKILIFRKGTIGDSICAMPAVIAIRNRFPQAQIHCLTNAVSEGQAGMSDFFDTTLIEHYLTFTAADRKLFQRIRQQKYDLVIELPQALDTWYTQIRNLILFRCAGIRYGAGWEVSTTFFFKKEQIKHIRFVREPLRLLKLLGSYHINSSASELYKLPQGLKHQFASIKPRYVIMGIGAKTLRSRWPVDRFKSIAYRITSESDLQVVLLGNKDDYELTKDWNINGTLNLCGQTTISETLAIISEAQFYVGNDTGLMHVAAAYNKPVAAVFSAKTYPQKWYPASDVSYIHADYSVSCALCSNHPCHNNICMQNIHQDVLWNSVSNLINSHSS